MAPRGPSRATASTEDWVRALETPRVLMSMVQAGPATDAVIDDIAPHLDKGDVIIDGGNANFRDTQRRHAKLAEQGIRFIGSGVSGGEEGALNGPSIMPGGDREAYDASVKPIFEAIAADVDGTPCCTYVGPDGAGHYVKMVHNGIEYADMQLIAESYDLLRNGVGWDVPQIAQRFHRWNESELESFLIEISARVLAKTDDATGKPLVDVILDAAEQKGTGRWTAQDALELGVPLTGITEAVFARTPERAQGPARPRRRCAQGAAPVSTRRRLARRRPRARAVRLQDRLLRAGLRPDGGGRRRRGLEHRPRRRWRRSGAAAASSAPASWTASARPTTPSPRSPTSCSPSSSPARSQNAQDPWRRVVGRAAELGIPTPAFSSSLAYYDGYRRARGPASLIQGLRDLFGAHTYKRVDREGTFHVMWGEDGREVET